MGAEKSIVRRNAERDPSYLPYCMRCRGLVRMAKVEPMYWRCACGAEHDERELCATCGGYGHVCKACGYKSDDPTHDCAGFDTIGCSDCGGTGRVTQVELH